MKLWIEKHNGLYRAYVKRGSFTIFVEAESREKAVRLAVMTMKGLIEREVFA